jgi:ribonuclease HII
MPELKAFFQSKFIEAGLDEAGRGCLAGPVVAAFVVLPKDYFHPYLNDSKQLTKKVREQLREEIIREAIDYGVAEVCNRTIDKINILNASFLAMHRALDKNKCQPEFLVIDGNRFKAYKNLPHECIVDGDCFYYSIAAASVLAKTYRDDLMAEMAMQYPGYDWENNMGYGTPKHREALAEKGLTPYHRLSFNLAINQLQLFD